VRILLLGGSGQVGWELQRSLAVLGEVHAPDSRMLDMADPDAIRHRVRALRPALIVNAAAYTAVDQAESEPEQAMALNARAPVVLAEEAKALDARLIHYSTDYVFDGRSLRPYAESDPPEPLNVYGRSKRLGEEGVLAVGGHSLILRTGWVYGARGRNFLLTMQRLLVERPQLTVVNDQHGAPTWCRHLADLAAQLAAPAVDWRGREGVYHAAAAGQTTWFGFAQAIRAAMAARGAGALAELKPITSAEYPAAALRPAYSLLDSRRLHREFGLSPPDWRESLALMLAEMP